MNSRRGSRRCRRSDAGLRAAIAWWFVACAHSDEVDWCADLVAVDECRRGNCIEVVCWPNAIVTGSMASTPRNGSEFRGSSPGCPQVVRTTLSRLELVRFNLRQSKVTDPRCPSKAIRGFVLADAGPYDYGAWRESYDVLMGTSLCDNDDRFLPWSHVWVQLRCR